MKAFLKGWKSFVIALVISYVLYLTKGIVQANRRSKAHKKDVNAIKASREKIRHADEKIKTLEAKVLKEAEKANVRKEQTRKFVKELKASSPTIRELAVLLNE